MTEIKIKKYNTIEEMNYNYNVLIEYKNKVNITKEQFDTLDSFNAYIELIEDYCTNLNELTREWNRNLYVLRKMLNAYTTKNGLDDDRDYKTNALYLNIINNYIRKINEFSFM